MNKVYPLFFNPGEVVEIRALGLRGKNAAWSGFAGGKGGIVSGYFNDPDKFAAAAAALDKSGARGVYFTINPCKPPLLSRAANRLVAPDKETTTPDQYMQCLRWFLVDLDAKLLDGTRRPSGISASEDELKVCAARAEEVAKYLEEEHGFARAIRAFSGNGYHLNYRLPDLPNDEAHHALIVQATAVLADKFGKEDIDVSVTNPGRIWKFYGTTGRKGDSTPDRPHRQSYIFKGQSEILTDVPITPIDVFKEFAALAASLASPPPGSAAVPPPAAGRSAAPVTPATSNTRPLKKNELGPIDMEKYLRHFGVGFHVKEINDPRRGPATAYILDHCVFNADHGPNEASIIVPRTGAILYQCFHASCKARTWKAARYAISGDKNLAEFCQGYDPNWQPPRQTGTGLIDNWPIPMTDATALKNGVGAIFGVLQPADMDPREFYEKKGKRPVFVPFRLAKYLAAYLHPICSTGGAFYHYEGGVWKEYPKTAIAQICVHAMREEIQAAWIESVTKILAGMVNREEEEWPDNPTLINVKNGMVDIAKMELLPHDPAWGSRTQLPVNYRPEAGKSDRWDTFLWEIFADDFGDTPEGQRLSSKVYAEKYGLLKQFFGYCLLRDTRYQRALFLYGTGANGKSTVLDVLEAMVGAENTSSLNLHDLSRQFRAQFIQNKLVNISTETDTKDPLSTNIFKAVVDGSPLTAERKYGEPFQFRSYAKWIVAMNEPLVTSDKSHGFGRRIMVLNFNRRFAPEEIKERMAEYLIEDIDLIFNFALAGLKLLLEKGFQVGDKIKEDTDKMMEVINPLKTFVIECCEVDDNATRGIYETSKQLWYAYTGWCAEGKNRPLGRNKFYEQIQTTFTRVKKTRKDEKDAAGNVISQPTVFTGIRLTETGNEYAYKGKQLSDKLFKEKGY